VHDLAGCKCWGDFFAGLENDCFDSAFLLLDGWRPLWGAVWCGGIWFSTKRLPRWGNDMWRIYHPGSRRSAGQVYSDVAEYSIPSSENEEGGCSYYAVLVAAKGVQCMI